MRHLAHPLVSGRSANASDHNLIHDLGDAARGDPTTTRRAGAITTPGRYPRLRRLPCRRSSATSARAQDGARRNHAVFDEAPERDGKLSGHGDDANLAAPRTILGKPSPIPSGECALGLMPHPGPCDFDEQGSRRLVPSLADALLSLLVAACIRGRGEAEVGCQSKAPLRISSWRQLTMSVRVKRAWRLTLAFPLTTLAICPQLE